jgi:hypothetical protein
LFHSCIVPFSGPQRAARTGLFGAYLLDDEHHERVFAMLRAAASQLRVPVLAKIRLLPSLEATLAFCAGLRSCGISALAVHGRTRGFVEERRKGPADLAQVKAIVRAMAQPASGTSGGLLVWSNGNVRCERDVSDNITFTGASGCMIGEALLNDPTLCERIVCASPATVQSAAASIPASSVRSVHAAVGLTLPKLRRKLAIVEEYVRMIQQPGFDYFSPFAGPSNGAATSPASAISAAASLSPRAADNVSDSDWCIPLVSFSSFQSHVYRLLNADSRARFLWHTQLTDEFLDTHTLGQLRSVLREVESRMELGRPFDPELQVQLDALKAARQAARAAAEKARVSASTGVRTLNSKQRKRARWQQRKADAKRSKENEGSALSAETAVAAADASKPEGNPSLGMSPG